MSTTTRGTGRRTARSAGRHSGFFPGLPGTISPPRSTGRDAAQAVERGTHARRAARRVAALGIAAALATGGFGSLVVAQPAHAATAEADIEAKVGNTNIQGKAGAKTSVGYQVTNHGKIDVGVTVTIQVPGNSEIESAGNCTVGGNRRAASCQLTMKANASVNGAFQVVLKTAGEGDGGVVARISPNQKVTDPKSGNDVARFKVRVTGASATPSASKSSRASRSASADPTATSDEVIAPPEAGNGAIPREDPKTPVSDNSGGLSFGFWIGVFAIVAALGLVGSLFYFRRKDRLEPDTGVFNLPTAGHDNPTSVITPGVYGSPAAGPAFQNGPGFQNGAGFQNAPAFQNGAGYGQPYGQGSPAGQGAPGAPGGSNVYGASAGPQAAAPIVPPAAVPPPAIPPAIPPVAPPAGGPAAPSPGANDQTIIMRRPDDL